MSPATRRYLSSALRRAADAIDDGVIPIGVFSTTPEGLRLHLSVEEAARNAQNALAKAEESGYSNDCSVCSWGLMIPVEQTEFLVSDEGIFPVLEEAQ